MMWHNFKLLYAIFYILANVLSELRAQSSLQSKFNFQFGQFWQDLGVNLES